MLIKWLIIILGSLLYVVSLLWFFCFNKRFSKITVLFLDSVIVVLSIGTISSGLLLRNQFLDESIQNEAKSKEGTENSNDFIGNDDNGQELDNKKENKSYSDNMTTIQLQPETDVLEEANVQGSEESQEVGE
ncbi:MAG: hypothetical protein K2O16_19965 [Lachnospiraceae bacterium]|nr:hypothetical protein [Lachnospiraceae bacterium]MDE7334460.1 hypothetical protein [Lachnospiraceae bacterium]